MRSEFPKSSFYVHWASISIEFEQDCFAGLIPEMWVKAFDRLIYAEGVAQEVKADAWCLWKRWCVQLTRAGMGPIEVRGLLPLIKGRSVEKIGPANVTFCDGEKAFMRPQIDGPPKWVEGRRNT